MDRARQEDDATDELLGLLLDDLGPALQWYRDEVARCVGLSPTELLCLDICRRRGPISSGRVGEQLGLTRSAVAKLLRRLEASGHLVREPAPDREQEIHVRLRPHPARDALWESLRADMRRSVREAVADHQVRGRRHALVAVLVIRLSDACFGQARALAEATVRRRILAERRRLRREAGLDRPWWER